MKINSKNKQAIHNVLITDIQRRLFKQYNARKEEWNINDEDYDVQQTLLYDNVTKCNTLNDVNELLLDYTDVFDSYEDINVFTLDGTLNYVLRLLVERIENDAKIIHNLNLE